MDQPRAAFSGFVRSNTTPIPDVLFDELLSVLSGAELKVLLYIMRRTWGFKKDTDAIALSQFEKGIVTNDGRVLDRGCGLNRETICKALKSLEKGGYIESEKHVSRHGDKDITVYKIHFTDSSGSRKNEPPVVGKSDQGVGGLTDQGSRKTSKRVVGKSDLQETVVQETVKQQTEERTLVPSSTPVSPLLEWIKQEKVICPKDQAKVQEYVRELAPITTREQLHKLKEFARAEIKGQDKRVFLGNLAGSLDAFLQAERAMQPFVPAAESTPVETASQGQIEALAAEILHSYPELILSVGTDRDGGYIEILYGDGYAQFEIVRSGEEWSRVCSSPECLARVVEYGQAHCLTTIAG